MAGHPRGAAANVPFKLPAGNGTLVPNPHFVAQARCRMCNGPASSGVGLVASYCRCTST